MNLCITLFIISTLWVLPTKHVLRSLRYTILFYFFLYQVEEKQLLLLHSMTGFEMQMEKNYKYILHLSYQVLNCNLWVISDGGVFASSDMLGVWYTVLEVLKFILCTSNLERLLKHMSVNSSTKASARQQIDLRMHYAIVSKQGHQKGLLYLLLIQKSIQSENGHTLYWGKSNLDKLSDICGAGLYCKQVNSFFWGMTF